MMRAMITNITGRSRRSEAEPPTSERFPDEHFLCQLTQYDEHGRPFYVKYFFNLHGYELKDKPVSCHDCPAGSTEPATIRAEICSGTMEPQGSEFYGPQHMPKALQEVTELPAMS